MGQNQNEIDALLAEVTALAEEAIHDVGGAGPEESDGSSGGSHQADLAGGASPAPPVMAAAPPIAQPHMATPGERRDHTERILKLEVPVIVRLASRSMPLSEILGLSSGAIIEFEKSFDSELYLMINNKCIGNGQAVKVGENFGLRVTHLGTLRERLAALSGQ